MRSRIGRAAGVTLVGLVVITVTTGAVALAPGPTRPVSYVPGIVSVPSDPQWGGPMTFGIEVRSHVQAPTIVGVELVLYLSAPVGQRTIGIGAYHRTVRIPTNGTGTFRFTATAPKSPSGRELCLGITVVGNSSGAYSCTPVS